MGGPQASTQGAMSLNRNSEFIQAKQKTFRERERERLNNESQISRGRSVTKININFNGDNSSANGNPMTNSATNLNINGSVTAASPRINDDNKFSGSKLYASNSSAISAIQTKKTLQTTNSTSNLETNQSGSSSNIVTKGVYYPTMRSRPTRDNQLLLGLSTIQSSGPVTGTHQPDLNQLVTGVGYANPGSSTITKTQPLNKVSIPDQSSSLAQELGKSGQLLHISSIPSQSMNFPSLDDDATQAGVTGSSLIAGISKVSPQQSNQPGSLIQFHNSSSNGNL